MFHFQDYSCMKYLYLTGFGKISLNTANDFSPPVFMGKAIRVFFFFFLLVLFYCFVVVCLFVFSKIIMAEMDEELLAPAYGVVVSSGEL